MRGSRCAGGAFSSGGAGFSGLLLLPFLIFADDSLLFLADFDGFSVTADYAKGKNASFIVKGLRAVSDFEDEFQQALINKRLCDGIETVFLPADSEHMFLSSGMIKQICQLGGDVTPFLPSAVADEIISALRNK